MCGALGYPPLLAQSGLGDALRVATERSPVPTTVICEGHARYRQEVESAVYLCCLEGIQNINKHAGPNARALITVWEEGSSLCFSVADDGVGFEGAATARGAGLTNMADRVGAAGGDLRVSSARGRGPCCAVR
jgi:signal transduction histidine kinase